MNKNYSLGMILVCILVGYFWLQPLIFNFGSEIIDGRMEISLSQTTITSFDDIFSNIEKDKSLTPYFLLLLGSFIDFKGKIIFYYALIAMMGAIGSYVYFYRFSKSVLISVLLSIGYCCSLPLAVFFSSKYGIFSHLYTVIPLFGYLLYKALTDISHFYRYSFLFLFLSFLISPYNLSVYLIIILFGFWATGLLIIYSKERIFLSLRVYILILVSLIIPVTHIIYQINSFNRMSPAQMMVIQSESYQMTNSQSTYLNTSLLKGIWDFNVIWPINNKAYKFQDTYGNFLLISIYFTSLIILGISLFLYSSFGNIMIYRILGLTVILLIPMIVGAKEGVFADLYVYIYEKFTPFQIFRQGYKWMPIIVLVVMTTFALQYGVVKSKVMKLFSLFAVLFFVVYNILPFIFMQQVSDGAIFKIPSDYYEMKKYIPKGSSILLLPEQYHSSYEWGTPGGPIEIIYSINLIQARPEPKYSPTNVRYFGIVNHILNEQFQMVKGNTEYKYILIRKDLDFKSNPILIHDPIIFKTILDKNNFTKITETENLVLYLNN